MRLPENTIIAPRACGAERLGPYERLPGGVLTFSAVVKALRGQRRSRARLWPASRRRRRAASPPARRCWPRRRSAAGRAPTTCCARSARWPPGGPGQRRGRGGRRLSRRHAARGARPGWRSPASVVVKLPASAAGHRGGARLRRREVSATAVGTCPSPRAGAGGRAARGRPTCRRRWGAPGCRRQRRDPQAGRAVPVTYGVPTEIVAAAIRHPRPTSSTRRWPARTPPRRRPPCCGSRRGELAPGRWARLTAPAMRIRQHVNPLKSDLLDIADVPRVEVEPRARAGGRAGGGGGPLPD